MEKMISGIKLGNFIKLAEEEILKFPFLADAVLTYRDGNNVFIIDKCFSLKSEESVGGQPIFSFACSKILEQSKLLNTSEQKN